MDFRVIHLAMIGLEAQSQLSRVLLAEDVLKVAIIIPAIIKTHRRKHITKTNNLLANKVIL